MTREKQTITFEDIADLWRSIEGLERPNVRNDIDHGINNAVESALAEIEDRFQHYHVAGDDDICGKCGLHLYHDLHLRAPNNS